jgi:hypothetical protein
MPEDELGLMTEEAIVKALDAAGARLKQAERDRESLDKVIGAAREEQGLLERLLALRRGTAVGSEALPPRKEQTTPPSMADGKQPAVQAVFDELSAAGRPLHISELMRLLRSRNTAIPGSGTQANVITHLRRDQRIVRPSRGMYALSAWGLENMVSAPRKRRRRKRVRVRAAESRNES